MSYWGDRVANAEFVSSRVVLSDADSSVPKGKRQRAPASAHVSCVSRTSAPAKNDAVGVSSVRALDLPVEFGVERALLAADRAARGLDLRERRLHRRGAGQRFAEGVRQAQGLASDLAQGFLQGAVRAGCGRPCGRGRLRADGGSRKRERQD